MNASSTAVAQAAITTPLTSVTGWGARLSRLVPARLMHALIDRLDAAFDHGCIEGHLPDGSVRIVGNRGAGPMARIEVCSWFALISLLMSGSAGWFRSWMAGHWHSDDIVSLIAAFSANRVKLSQQGRARGPMRIVQRFRHASHANSRRGAKHNIHAHYDLGNRFYAAWLDPSMTYSSAMFDPDVPHEPLERAQQRKMDAILDRLHLSEGQKLLEIGCGWGALGERAIARLQVRYDGLTISDAQARVAAQRIHGGAGRILLSDYRDHEDCYDAIVSVEMVEAVGESYWPEYLGTLARLLKPGGRAAVQYIAIDDAVFSQYARGADFIQRYIFPGGCLISAGRFRRIAEEQGFSWCDQVDFPADYAETLRRWRARFDQCARDGLLPDGFDEQFCRLWRYYLMYCEAGFVGGGLTVAQVTLVNDGTLEGAKA